MSHERSQSTFQPLNQTTPRSGRPVVIRPMQPLEGTAQQVRVDAPQSIQGPHRRIERLEEYVSWLQQQSLQQSQPQTNPKPGAAKPGIAKPGIAKAREVPAPAAAPAAVKLKKDPTPIARAPTPSNCWMTGRSVNPSGALNHK